jgi:hypothetical protein
MMVRPVCRVLIPETLEQAFLFFAALLESLDLSLANPASAKITAWTDDGDQIEVATANMLPDVLSGSINNIQFWRNANEDVFVAWKHVQGGCAFSVYLDGLDFALSIALVSKITESVLIKFWSRYNDRQALVLEFE